MSNAVDEDCVCVYVCMYVYVVQPTTKLVTLSVAVWKKG